MADKEFLGDRRRKEEEEYFRKREEQLIDKLRQRRSEEATRGRMAERTGMADEEILRDLEALGYTPDTVVLLHLVPLVEIAWADGGVSDRERALILEAARTRGIQAGSAADQQLTIWLATRPSADFFEKTLRAIGAILEARPSEEREADRRDLLSYSMAIASASGGILGLGKVSQEEQQVLARVTQELERAHGSVTPPASPSGEGRA
jgi:tellurite resistance protein